MSNYCSTIANKHGIKIGGVNKLVPNFCNKTKFVLHFKNLPLYSSLGIKLVSVHRILKFKQSDWLKTYIYSYTDNRKTAVNSFGKDFLN